MYLYNSATHKKEEFKTHNGADGLSRAGGVDNQQHDVADQQAQHDAQQGCQQGLESLVPQEG